MKIGIYNDGSIDRRGGGFTFKNEVIQGIINSHTNPADEIFIFGWRKADNGSGKFKNIGTVTIAEPFLLRFLESVKRSLHKKIKSIILSARGEKREAVINPSINAMNLFAGIRARILEKSLLSHGADLIIYMEAFEIFTYKIPFILVSWDIAHLYTPFFPETNFENWEKFEKFKAPAIKRAVHIVVGTDTGKKQIHSQYRIPEDRISVIPFPTPVYLLSQRSEGLLSNKTNFDPEKEFIFYPSSFWPHKNHFLLIEAMRIIVKEKHIDIKLTLCGSDKGNKRFIQKLIDKNNLNENVYVFDFLERSEINFLYSKAIAMVFPTYIGPDNFPPLEAFGLGCPVIASSVQGAKEQLGDNALLFDPFSVDDLVDKILMIRNDRTKRDLLIKQGFEKAKSWNSNDYAKSLLSTVEKYRPYSRCYDLKTYRTMYA